jgi:hypothetical protein
MSKLPPERPRNEHNPRGGWTSQLVALLREAAFDPTWAPAARLILFAVVGVALVIALRVISV